MSQAELLLEKHDGIARLTLNREERRNALSPSLLQSMREAFATLEKDDSVRIVCITGAGEKAFCAGADLLASMQASDSDPMQSTHQFALMLQDIRQFSKPIVARVNGHCLGGGLGLALACDIVIAQDKAKFGTPEVNVGLFPMMIAPLILQHMPRKHALKMILCGDKISAQDALAHNLVNQVVPLAQLDEATDQVLQSLLAAAPLAQQYGKEALSEVENMSYHDAVEHLSGHLSRLMQTEDAIEGISAFMQKRKPAWKGK